MLQTRHHLAQSLYKINDRQHFHTCTHSSLHSKDSAFHRKKDCVGLDGGRGLIEEEGGWSVLWVSTHRHTHRQRSLCCHRNGWAGQRKSRKDAAGLLMWNPDTGRSRETCYLLASSVLIANSCSWVIFDLWPQWVQRSCSELFSSHPFCCLL